MKRINLIIIALCATMNIQAQRTMSDMLNEIEQNNSTLKALRQQADADKREAGTGLGPGDLEIGLNRLWGSPTAIGNRTDFSISQPIDIATVGGSKKRVADRKRQGINLQYAVDRNAVMLEAKKLIIDIIYFNAMAKEADIRMAHADTIMQSEKSKYECGEIDMIEYNNARINYANATAMQTQINSQRDAAIASIKRLNGGKSIDITQICYEPISLPRNFDLWYDNIEKHSLTMALWANNVALRKKEVTLAKTENLPSLSVGYMSEKTVGERYQGVALGMTIPIWNNRNKVKQAKAAMEATKEYQKDAQCQLRSILESLYIQCTALKQNTDTYRQALDNANNSQMLKTALNLGEISLVEYMMQMALLYDTIDNALSTERDYQKAYAEMMAAAMAED